MRFNQNEIARDTLDLIFKRLNHLISKDEYIMGIVALEKRYPHIEPYSFLDVANDYAKGKRCTWWPEIQIQKGKQYYLPYKDDSKEVD